MILVVAEPQLELRQPAVRDEDGRTCNPLTVQ
jgi:hypothetical protein